MSRSCALLFGFWLSLAAIATCVRADDSPASRDPRLYLGAAEAIRKFSPPGIAPAGANSDSRAQLRSELDSFSTAAARLAPRDAAARWLALADRYEGLPRPNRNAAVGQERITFGDVLSRLPPPEAWDDLGNQILSRLPSPPHSVLDVAWSLLGHVLLGSQEGQVGDLEAFRDLSPKTAGSKGGTGEIASFASDLAMHCSPELALRALNLQLVLGGNGREARLWIPDVAGAVGTAKMEQFLRAALASPFMLQISPGQTQSLARQLALRQIDHLTSPQWALAQSLDGLPLYEALARLKPPAPPQQQQQQQQRRLGGFGLAEMERENARDLAHTYSIFALVRAGRIPEAVAAAHGAFSNGQGYFADTLAEKLEADGQGDRGLDFYRQALNNAPELSLWDSYLRIAAEHRRLPGMIAQINALTANPQLTLATYSVLKVHLMQALLLQDRVSEGVEVLRGLLGARHGVRRGAPDQALQWGVKLARIGRLTRHKEWVDEGTRVALETASQVNSDSSWWQYSQAREAVRLLEDSDRSPAVERVLLDRMQSIAEVNATHDFSLSFRNNNAVNELVELAGIYHRAGRYTDVLLLLNRAKGWEAKDLREILFRTDCRDLCLGYMAANALAETSRSTEAIPLLKAVLEFRSDYDPAHELLIRLEGVKSLPYLESMALRDPLETRPLLWKAQVLLKAGKLTEAEQAARAAIAGNPRDTRQTPGRAMRAYSVLADIREARGDAEQAGIYRNVVQGTRLCERADELSELGLAPQAITVYQESLSHFPGDANAEAQLGIELANLGRGKEAEVHLRRAIRLMPECIDRRGVPDLGLNQILQNPIAAPIADAELQQMIQSPKSSMPYYLLGRLREQQLRYGEALRCYREAVARDPNFAGAWARICSGGSNFPITLPELDQAIRTYSRLDPAGRHQRWIQSDRPTRFDLSYLRFTDARTAWESTAELLRRFPDQEETPLLALPGAVQALDEANVRPGSRRFRSAAQDGTVQLTGNHITPGAAVAAQASMSRVAAIFDAQRQSGSE